MVRRNFLLQRVRIALSRAQCRPCRTCRLPLFSSRIEDAMGLLLPTQRFRSCVRQSLQLARRSRRPSPPERFVDRRLDVRPIAVEVVGTMVATRRSVRWFFR